jgi:hypothetical protein
MKSVPFLLSSISAVISERNQPGAMGVHPDAAAGPLSGEFPGEVDDRALGSGVGGLGNRRRGDEAERGRDIDDRPGSLRDHDPGGPLAHGEQADEVHLG